MPDVPSPLARRASSSETFANRHARAPTAAEGDFTPLDDLLRETFLGVLRDTTGAEFESVIKEIYDLSDEHHAKGDPAKFEQLLSRLKGMSPDESLLVASAFSNLLSLHNLSEEVANSQRERLQRLGDVPAGPVKSTNGTFEHLISSGVKPEEIYKSLCAQQIDLVFTAHPTQALRRSMLKNFAAIRSSLDRLNRVRLSRYERNELLQSIRAYVQAAWRTDEIRRSPPSPIDELRGGLNYFQETIFAGLPKFLRRVDTALANIGQPRIPFDHAPIVFSSWMAGDRDGNPFVTAECTREAVNLCQFTAATLYFKEVQSLMFELSMWRASDELHAYASTIKGAGGDAMEELRLTEERKRRNYSDFWRPIPHNEPYRLVLSEVRDRLYDTHQMLQSKLAGMPYSAVGANPYRFADELLKPLLIMYRSLVATGDSNIANGHLLDLIRQVKCFGLCLVKLDIRQESERHADVMDAITTWLGLGSYKSWPEEKKVEWLVSELQGKRPLISHDLPKTAEVKEVLDTFKVIAELQAEGDNLGAYVISMSTAASDVLSVVLLQRECGCPESRMLRVAPLFERLDDLDNAPATLKQLFSVPWYKEHIKGKQEVMIGYSDSGKDAGRLSAAWALFEGQEKAVQVGKEFGVAVTLFHGRGGTVGRGGGPANLAILSQPPGTINGQLRVTIQGEIIENDFGEHEMCFRTLDLYTAATIEHSLKPPQAPEQKWRDVMKRMSAVSCNEYRSIVFNEPKFIKYFHQATPCSELGRMNIGSRPAKRRPNAGVESLRAIPWIFAWTQTRLQLPVWLGIGKAFQAEIDAGNLATLQEMYHSWPFFKVTIDMVEMVLAKADPRITQLYDEELIEEPELRKFGTFLREKLAEMEASLLKVTGHTSLLEGPAGAFGVMMGTLKHKLDLRTPYITPLNMLQVKFLKLERALESGESKSDDKWAPKVPWAKELLKLNEGKSDLQSAIEDTIIITVKGIAAGMQNTG